VTAMKRTLVLLSFIILATVCNSAVHARDAEVFLNAFGETATAYLNDSHLLLGTTADGFVARIIPRETAADIAKNVQKRVRRIRGKLKLISDTRVSDADRQLIGLLDGAYACMDHQSWALIQYIDEGSPESARRFDSRRNECLTRIRKLMEFYLTLPRSAEVPEPLSTR
jgi:hypothetical protein